MLALKEYATFIFLNLANLATTYDRLLAENDQAYQTLPADTRIASARRLIKAVAEACEAGTPDPFRQHFDNPNKTTHLPGSPKPAQPLLEIECLSQTLTPVVTNLEAGKFLWHMLSEARATTLHSLAHGSLVLLLRPAAPAMGKEMKIPRPEEDQPPSRHAVVSKREESSH